MLGKAHSLRLYPTQKKISPKWSVSFTKILRKLYELHGIFFSWTLSITMPNANLEEVGFFLETIIYPNILIVKTKLFWLNVSSNH
jgi:hypothetical protein